MRVIFQDQRAQILKAEPEPRCRYVLCSGFQPFIASVYSTNLVAQLGYHLYFTTMVTESYSIASVLHELVTQYGISIARILQPLTRMFQ